MGWALDSAWPGRVSAPAVKSESRKISIEEGKKKKKKKGHGVKVVGRSAFGRGKKGVHLGKYSGFFGFNNLGLDLQKRKLYPLLLLGLGQNFQAPSRKDLCTS